MQCRWKEMRNRVESGLNGTERLHNSGSCHVGEVAERGYDRTPATLVTGFHPISVIRRTPLAVGPPTRHS
jgi:hypothetical protein